MTSPTEMTATVTLKVGPMKASFAGKVTLTDMDPPAGCRISGKVVGGVAGSAKGGADVKLTADGPEATLLAYAVDAQIGGKIAELGSRLIDSTAKKLAGEFFARLSREIAPASAEPATEAPETSWLQRGLGLFAAKPVQKPATPGGAT